MKPPRVEPPTPAGVKPSVDYPESDGKPVGETDFHITVIFYLRQALRHFFHRAEKVYVAANMFFYYEEGNPGGVTAPDTFVVKGVPKHDRRTYKLWEEKVAPCVTIEVTSLSSRIEDLGTKKGVYEMLGVREYFVFDPLKEYLNPPFQGFELAGGFYRPMSLRTDNTLLSQELGLILRPDGPLLRLVDPATGLVIPTLAEAVALADWEAQRADAAEAEMVRLRSELEKLRGPTGGYT
jgi:Uma2 family endonuclease